jgi:hypothetical protein
MPGFDNGCVYFEEGIDPRGTPPVANQMNVNGQLLIGSINSPYVICSTLTAGSGISITNAPGSITLAATAVGMTWTAVGSGGALASNHGYICTGGGNLSFSLPATSAVGDTISLTVDGATTWAITQGAGQQIRFGAFQTTAGVAGTLVSTAQGDTVTIVCSVADLTWNVISSIGNITIA